MRYEYKKRYKELVLNEGIINKVKDFISGLSGKLKPNNIEKQLIFSIYPILMKMKHKVYDLDDVIAAQAEKLGIDLDPDDIVHMIHIIEHMMASIPQLFESEELFEDVIDDSKKTIAIVPGSFKPPHRGHLDMVKQYSKVADEVIIIVSNPSGQKRITNIGKEITSKIAKKIFELYVKKAKLKNVTVIISDSPSPIKSAYDYVEANLNDGENVLLGSSDKGGDWKRWTGAPRYFDKVGQNVNIIDPQQASVRASGNISASDIRATIDSLETIRHWLPKELTDKDLDTIQSWVI